MVNRNLIRSLESDPSLKAVFQAAMGDANETIVTEIESESDFDVNKIVEGRIVRIDRIPCWSTSDSRAKARFPRRMG